MLISCISEEEFKNQSINDSAFFEIIENLKKINSIISMYVMCLNFELDDTFNDMESDYILQDFLFKNVSGKRYDVFEIEHYIDIFNPLKKEFFDCFGFEVEHLYNGITNLKEKFTFGLNSSIERIDEIIQNQDLSNATEEMKNEMVTIMYDMIGIELHNICEITKWPVKFIKLFSYELGDNKQYLDNNNFFEFIDLEKKIKDKTILKINDNYYCFLIQEFLDSFDKKIIKEMCKILESDAEKLRSKHTSNVESIVEKLFLNILPKSKSYLNNYYKYKRQLAENELLIEYDKNIFIIEIKSGAYTPDFAIQDFKSHYESLKTLMVKADEQSERLSELINENDSIEIYDSNKRDKEIKCVLNKKDINNIYKIVITLENFNEHEARAEKLGFIKLNNNTLFISLDDLRVYSDYFKNSPTIFVHYLNQRVLATRNEHINLIDELDHLGM